MSKELVADFSTMVAKITDKDDLIEQIVLFIKQHVNAEAIGLRLVEGEDFPYYTTLGFTDSFVKLENHLCKKDQCGKIVRDNSGKPILECMCGDIINSHCDASCKFYTRHGSFRMTKDLEDNVKAMNCIVRGRCMQEGYKSVAIIPIPYGDKNIGLIQLNDRKEHAFPKEDLEMVEQLSVIIGRAIGSFMALHQDKKERREELAKNIVHITNTLLSLTDALLKKYS